VASAVDSVGAANPQSVTATPAITTLPTVTFTETASTPPTTGAVSLKSLAFNPTGLVVQSGGTVTWTWNDSPTAHNPYFQPTDPTPHPADSPTQATGTESFTFTTLGTYHFFCSIHGAMTGTLTVVR
jgi:plastocyanin